jgi:hypothetical protein
MRDCRVRQSADAGSHAFHGCAIVRMIWTYWLANIKDAGKSTGPLPDSEPVSGSLKGTTHWR